MEKGKREKRAEKEEKEEKVEMYKEKLNYPKQKSSLKTQYLESRTSQTNK